MPAAMVIPAPLAYIKVVAVCSLWVSPPSQEGMHAYIPRQTMLVPRSQEEVGKSGASSHGNSSSVSIY